MYVTSVKDLSYIYRLLFRKILNFCFICNKLLSEDETVAVGRAMSALIEASVAGGDEFTEFLKSQESVTIHVACRKSYTQKSLRNVAS